MFLIILPVLFFSQFELNWAWAESNRRFAACKAAVITTRPQAQPCQGWRKYVDHFALLNGPIILLFASAFVKLVLCIPQTSFLFPNVSLSETMPVLFFLTKRCPGSRLCLKAKWAHSNLFESGFFFVKRKS